MSFYCENCGFKNAEIQPGGKLKEKGVRINHRLTHGKDLNRDIVRSEYATLTIPEIDFEIPASNKKGSLNTVEGVFQNIIDDLGQQQENRQKETPELHDKIVEFIKKLEKMKNGEGFPFHIILDDPSGNSYIKNPFAPNSDPEMKIEKYFRTKEQCEIMGYDWDNAQTEMKQLQEEELKESEEFSAHKALDLSRPIEEQKMKEESLCFKTPCHECGQEGENKMCTIAIPYFKELIVMAFSCDNCGAKSREVKTGGKTSEKAKKITLAVTSEDDLKRDVFKSDSAVLFIPELEIEMLMGTLGGIYSTVEGLVRQVKENLLENNPFVGDSDPLFKGKMKKVTDLLEECLDLKRKFTIILDDPLDNSFIQNPDYPQQDKSVIVEVYDRTKEQNEELGLLDIKTENYQ